MPASSRKPTTVPAVPETPPSQASDVLAEAAQHSASSKPATVPAADPPAQADTGLTVATEHLQQDQFAFVSTVADAKLDALPLQNVPEQGLTHLPTELPPAELPPAALPDFVADHFPTDIVEQHFAAGPPGWLFS